MTSAVELKEQFIHSWVPPRQTCHDQPLAVPESSCQIPVWGQFIICRHIQIPRRYVSHFELTSPATVITPQRSTSLQTHVSTVISSLKYVQVLTGRWLQTVSRSCITLAT
jgi:hypothetical protein